MKVVVLQNTSGFVSLVTPVEPMRSRETETDYLNRITARALVASPSLSGFVYVGSTDKDRLPSKQPLLLPGATHYDFGNGTQEINPINYRECFVWNSGTQRVDVDPNLFRQEYLRVLRLERQRRLLASDGKAMQIGEGGNPQQIAQYRLYRQQLRDLPQQAQQALDNIPTVSGIAGYTPPWPVEP